MEYYFAIIILLIILIIYINLKDWSSANHSNNEETILPSIDIPGYTYDSTFAEETVRSFDANDLTGIDTVVGVGGGEAPQLTENAVESPEYKRQMRSLIEYLLRIGYRKKIVNDYINHIKDKHLSPQLILTQLKNDAHAPPANIS